MTLEKAVLDSSSITFYLKPVKCTLRTFVTYSKDLTLSTLLYLFKLAANGLLHLHNLDIIHNDIKPENLLIGFDGVVYVSEFGASYCPSEQDFTFFGLFKIQNDLSKYSKFDYNSSSFEGSEGYTSPERCLKQDYSYSSDIYSFGVLAYKMLYLYEATVYGLKVEEIKAPNCEDFKKHHYAVDLLNKMMDFLNKPKLEDYKINGKKALEDRQTYQDVLLLISFAFTDDVEDRSRRGNILREIQLVMIKNIKDGKIDVLSLLDNVPFRFADKSLKIKEEYKGSKDLSAETQLSTFVKDIQDTLVKSTVNKDIIANKIADDKILDDKIKAAIDKESTAAEQLDDYFHREMLKKLKNEFSKKIEY